MVPAARKAGIAACTAKLLSVLSVMKASDWSMAMTT
jgi:hypothetical protein